MILIDFLTFYRIDKKTKEKALMQNLSTYTEAELEVVEMNDPRFLKDSLFP